MLLQSFIYSKTVKSTNLPKVIQMTMPCSCNHLWQNKAGLCEVQSRIYVVNQVKSSHLYLYSAFNNTNYVKATAKYQNRNIFELKAFHY